jgi:hypothetical protein
MKTITEKQWEAMSMMWCSSALRYTAIHPLVRNALTSKGLAKYRQDRFVLTAQGRDLIEARLHQIKKGSS